MQEQLQPHCIFYVKNYGKTFARMLAWRYELQISNSPDIPHDVTVYDMANLPTFSPDVIPQDASAAQEARLVSDLARLGDTRVRRDYNKK